MYCNFGCDRLVRIIRQVLANRITEREFALLSKLRYGNAGKGLVYGTQIELRLHIVGSVSTLVRQAISFFEDWLTALSDQSSSGKTIFCDSLCQISLSLLY